MSGSSVLAGSHCRSSVVISRPRSSPVSRRPPVVARPTHVARHNVPVANFPGFLFNTCVAAYRRLLHGSQHRSRWTRRRPQHAWRNAHNCASVARAHSATKRPSALSGEWLSLGLPLRSAIPGHVAKACETNNGDREIGTWPGKNALVGNAFEAEGTPPPSRKRGQRASAQNTTTIGHVTKSYNAPRMSTQQVRLLGVVDAGSREFRHKRIAARRLMWARRRLIWNQPSPPPRPNGPTPPLSFKLFHRGGTSAPHSRACDSKPTPTCCTTRNHD